MKVHVTREATMVDGKPVYLYRLFINDIEQGTFF